jgi:hypothetical protein
MQIHNIAPYQGEFQDCVSGSVFDPDSIRSSGSVFGTGFRKEKMTHRSSKKLEISCFEVLDFSFES